MDANNPITAAVFSAFLNCPTKAHLLAIGAQCARQLLCRYRGAHFIYVQIGGETRTTRWGRGSRTSRFQTGGRNFDYQTTRHYVDCETAVYNFRAPRRPKERQPQPSAQLAPLCPCCFRLRKSQTSPTRFACVSGRSASSQRSGIVADTGTLIYGDGHHHKSVKIADHVTRTLKIVDAIEATRCGRETAAAHSEQALRGLRLPTKVSRRCHRT